MIIGGMDGSHKFLRAFIKALEEEGGVDDLFPERNFALEGDSEDVDGVEGADTFTEGDLESEFCCFPFFLLSRRR